MRFRVLASQSAMARMLGMQAGHLNNVMARKAKTNNIFCPVTRLKANVLGGRGIILFGVETIVALAALYNPELATRFSIAGAMVYLYQLAGYKVTVDVKPVVPSIKGGFFYC